MPLYEYRCSKCSTEFELLVRSQDTPKCPHCGAKKLDRQMSVAAGHVRSAGVDNCPGPSPACGQVAGCCGCSRS